MSVTSRLSFQRSNAQQPQANLYGQQAAGSTALGGNGGAASPTIGGAVSGGGGQDISSASFPQIAIGLVAVVGIWWGLRWAIHRIIPVHDTPHFLEDFLHGLDVALIVLFWFVLWKMSAGIGPLKDFEPYRTIVLGA